MIPSAVLGVKKYGNRHDWFDYWIMFRSSDGYCFYNSYNKINIQEELISDGGNNRLKM